MPDYIVRESLIVLFQLNGEELYLPMNDLARRVAKSLMASFYEYLLVVSPVLLFLMLDSVARNNWSVLISSPEWSIATIFLAFQGRTIHRRCMAGRRVSDNWLALIDLAAVFITVASSIDAYISLSQNPQDQSPIFRLSILIVVSVLFLIFTGAGIFTTEHEVK